MLGAVGLLVIAFGPGFISLVGQSWASFRLERKLHQLHATQQALATERERLTSDPTYIEGLTRSTFKVAKPGELVVPLESASTQDRTR